MKAVDTNVLIYAHRGGLPQHAAAKALLIELAEGHERWAIPVFCLVEFLRVVTHPKFIPMFTIDEAVDAVGRLLVSPSLEILFPGDRFLALLFEAMADAKATGNLVFDAQIVALCREAGVRELMTEDRDFRRFKSFAAVPL